MWMAVIGNGSDATDSPYLFLKSNTEIAPALVIMWRFVLLIRPKGEKNLCVELSDQPISKMKIH